MPNVGVILLNYKISEDELLMIEQALATGGKSKYRNQMFSDIRTRKINSGSEKTPTNKQIDAICQHFGTEIHMGKEIGVCYNDGKQH